MVLLTFPILLSLAAFGVGWGSALRIEIQPPTYAEGDSGPINVSCTIDHQDSDAVEIFMVKILKDGEKPLVVLRLSGIHLGSGVKPSKFLTEGLIGNDTSTNYMKLGILDPTTKDEGKYTCLMHFIDKHLQLSERRASANVTQLTLNDVVMMLRGQMTTLEGKLEAQTSKLEEQTSKASLLEDEVATLKDQTKNQSHDITDVREQDRALDEMKEVMSDMARKVSDQQGEIDGLRKENQNQKEMMKDMAAKDSDLQGELDDVRKNQTEMLKDMAATDSDQQRKIDGLRKETQHQKEKMKDMAAKVLELSTEKRNTTSHLKEKDSFLCGFYARLYGASVIGGKTDIVFGNVKTNIGGGYNVSDGVFTAPRDGLYVFTLGMTAWMGSKYCCYGQVHLFVNGVMDGFVHVKDPAATRKNRFPQSTLTRVVSLTKGDTVKAWNREKKMRWSSTSYFSGFLL